MLVLKEKIQSYMKKGLVNIRCRIEWLRGKLENFLGIHPVYSGLIYTYQEEDMIEKTAEIVCDFFPESPKEYLLEEDYESRCEAIEDLGNRLIEYYELDGLQIVITADEEIFPPNRATYIYGCTSVSHNKIYINANCLMVDDAQVLENIVITIIHELRHMIQYQIARLEKTYGVSYERRCIWRHNMVNYIEAEYDMEGYYTQPIEMDARNFANRVWQKAYNKDVK